VNQITKSKSVKLTILWIIWYAIRDPGDHTGLDSLV